MRINETEVAGKLALIANRPGERNARRDGDVEGDFDAWFDGGAMRYVTGHTEYFLSDGARARVATSPLHLLITLQFADGRSVTITQK